MLWFFSGTDEGPPAERKKRSKKDPAAEFLLRPKGLGLSLLLALWGSGSVQVKMETEPCSVHGAGSAMDIGNYSYSTVAGGLDEISYTTLVIPATSLVMRLLARSSTSYGRRDHPAVIKSSVTTALSATVYP